MNFAKKISTLTILNISGVCSGSIFFAKTLTARPSTARNDSFLFSFSVFFSLLKYYWMEA